MRADLQEMGNELWGVHLLFFWSPQRKGRHTAHSPLAQGLPARVQSGGRESLCALACLPSPGPTAPRPALSGRPHQETESRTVPPVPRCVKGRYAPAPSPRQQAKQKLEASEVCPDPASTARPAPHSWGIIICRALRPREAAPPPQVPGRPQPSARC